MFFQSVSHLKYIRSISQVVSSHVRIMIIAPYTTGFNLQIISSFYSLNVKNIYTYNRITTKFLVSVSIVTFTILSPQSCTTLVTLLAISESGQALHLFVPYDLYNNIIARVSYFSLKLHAKRFHSTSNYLESYAVFVKQNHLFQ